MANRMKMCRLYFVRYRPEGEIFSKTVGYKGKLMPRRAALRIVRRLKKSKVDAMTSAMEVNVSLVQDVYLKRRYG